MYVHAAHILHSYADSRYTLNSGVVEGDQQLVLQSNSLWKRSLLVLLFQLRSLEMWVPRNLNKGTFSIEVPPMCSWTEMVFVPPGVGDHLLGLMVSRRRWFSTPLCQPLYLMSVGGLIVICYQSFQGGVICRFDNCIRMLNGGMVKSIDYEQEWT